MIEITFTTPLTTYNNSEPIISALFSSAKPLRSPRLAKLKNSFKFDRKRCDTSRFSRPFCLLDLLENDSFLSVFSKAAILSLTPFLQRRRVLNETIILLGLAGYEMIITNLELRASLVIP